MTTPRRVLRHWLLILAVSLIALIWVAYRVHQLRRDVLASVAQCPLNQLMLGLHNYHDVYGSFPPACVKDDRGRPLHSWRVLILPYINEQALYEQYDFSVPWNSPHNSRLNDRMPDMFHSCTEVRRSHSPIMSSSRGQGPSFRSTAVRSWAISQTEPRTQSCWQRLEALECRGWPPSTSPPKKPFGRGLILPGPECRVCRGDARWWSLVTGLLHFPSAAL